MDLSKVLGDVYADDVRPAAASRPTAPDWADEAHLDAAFSNWTPGPPPEAPAAEHEMAAHHSLAASRAIDDLATAVGSVLTAPAPPAVAVVPRAVEVDIDVHMALADVSQADVAYELAPLPVPERPAGWSRGDDDVLPTGARRRGRFSLLSR